MHATRRQFLAATAGSAAILSIDGGVPEVLLRAAEQKQAETGDRVLVVIQLSGGNDGLNTVVPFGDEAYYQARPELALDRNSVLKIDDHLAFHPSLQGLADLLDDGKLSIIQGVGYPKPNRSHFESMDIWHTCRRKGEDRSDGWLGRYLDQLEHRAGGDVPALHFGDDDQPAAVRAREVRVPSVRSLDRFRLLENGQINRDEMSRLVGARRTTSNDLLDFVQSSSRSALEASRRVNAARRNYQPTTSYPETELAQKLRTIAQLIDADLATRIYYVTIDGFDTHARQAEAHSVLLREWSGALQAFLTDVAGHGHGERVLALSFSEFGRRVQENASLGTDHGAAAPVFLAGARVNAGPLGIHPSLTDLEQGDLRFHTDFRQVYATVLERWLNWPSEKVLGGRFSPIDAIRTG